MTPLGMQAKHAKRRDVEVLANFLGRISTTAASAERIALDCKAAIERDDWREAFRLIGELGLDEERLRGTLDLVSRQLPTTYDEVRSGFRYYRDNERDEQ